MRASNLQKPHPPLCLNPSHACIRPAKTSPTAASVSFACLHHTCTILTHSCVGIHLMRASKLHKPHSLLRLNPYHACNKPAQTSRTSASESLSCVHQTCKNLPQPLCLNPSHACIRPAKTSPTAAPVSFACMHQTCTNLSHSCV